MTEEIFARGTARIAGAVFAAVLIAGCGADEDDGSAGGQAGAAPDGGDPAQSEVSDEDDTDGEMTGVWESIVEENEVETLTISRDEVATTGPLSCPGSLDTSDEEPVITLECAVENEHRERGIVELDPDGTHLFITWDGEEWGGMIDSFTKTDREPDFSDSGG